jgi:putative spermidine/putrescine transport system permease protein
MTLRASTLSAGFVTGLTVVFLMLPALLSILAGLSANYAHGVRSGLTLGWLVEVWSLYADTMLRSILIAFATLLIVTLIAVPAAYALLQLPQRFALVIEEIITLPVAIPGLALALALILAYGSAPLLRGSSLFIVIGHVLYTLPFMLRAVLAVLRSMDWKTLDEGAASLSATTFRRFWDIIIPNAMPGIVAGALTVVTLSIGEFNLTWMLHTPLTKTLPVGLADSYASMRLEIASAYTLVFFLMIIPLLLLLQGAARRLQALEARR